MYEIIRRSTSTRMVASSLGEVANKLGGRLQKKDIVRNFRGESYIFDGLCFEPISSCPGKGE